MSTLADAGMKERMDTKASREAFQYAAERVPLKTALLLMRERAIASVTDPRERAIVVRLLEDAVCRLHTVQTEGFTIE